MTESCPFAFKAEMNKFIIFEVCCGVLAIVSNAVVWWRRKALDTVKYQRLKRQISDVFWINFWESFVVWCRGKGLVSFKCQLLKRQIPDDEVVVVIFAGFSFDLNREEIFLMSFFQWCLSVIWTVVFRSETA